MQQAQLLNRQQAQLLQPYQVTVELWDLVLRSNTNMTGYATFKCTFKRSGHEKVRFMATRVTSTTKGEWTFPISSNGVVLNMVPANDQDLARYIRKNLQNGGQYYVASGSKVNMPHPPLVTQLIDAMKAICKHRNSKGQPYEGLRAETMSALNLNARKHLRENAEYGDMALAGIDWAFMNAEAWRRVAYGEESYLEQRLSDLDEPQGLVAVQSDREEYYDIRPSRRRPGVVIEDPKSDDEDEYHSSKRRRPGVVIEDPATESDSDEEKDLALRRLALRRQRRRPRASYPDVRP